MNIVTTPNDLTKLEVLDRSGDKITVLNPMGYPPKITRKTAAPRLESLTARPSTWSTAGSTIRSSC